MRVPCHSDRFDERFVLKLHQQKSPEGDADLFLAFRDPGKEVNDAN